MRYVWLLWGSDTETPWVEGVYTSKIQAEADLRLLEESEADKNNPYGGRGFIYWVQEKELQ